MRSRCAHWRRNRLPVQRPPRRRELQRPNPLRNPTAKCALPPPLPAAPVRGARRASPLAAPAQLLTAAIATSRQAPPPCRPALPPFPCRRSRRARCCGRRCTAMTPQLQRCCSARRVPLTPIPCIQLLPRSLRSRRITRNRTVAFALLRSRRRNPARLVPQPRAPILMPNQRNLRSRACRPATRWLSYRNGCDGSICSHSDCNGASKCSATINVALCNFFDKLKSVHVCA